MLARRLQTDLIRGKHGIKGMRVTRYLEKIAGARSSDSAIGMDRGPTHVG